MDEETKNRKIKECENQLDKHILAEFKTEVIPLFKSKESIKNHQPTSILVSRVFKESSTGLKQGFYYSTEFKLDEK